MRRLSVFFIVLFTIACKAQSYNDTITRFRDKYIADLLADKRAPIKSSQVKYLSFYKPDERYRVWADVRLTPGSAPFLVQTHSGKQKPYREYAVLSFKIDNTACTLHVYQSMDLVKQDDYKDYLFLPFTDETNYETTYAGGRYIDLKTDDLQGGKVLLDLNKCYNPYCAYADGYSCPIPPDENRLRVRIEAGEKMFTQ